MAHEIAKLMLEQADTWLERSEAVQISLNLGMPLREIEEYLDWLENVRWARGRQRRDHQPQRQQRQQQG